MRQRTTVGSHRTPGPSSPTTSNPVQARLAHRTTGASGALGRPGSQAATAANGHALSALRVHPPQAPAASVTAPHAAAAPIQLGIEKRVKARRSKARFARRWQASFNSRKNLATLKLRHVKSGKVLYINAESLGMGFKSFTSPHEKTFTKAGTPKRRKHSEPQLLLAWQNQMIKKGNKTYDLKNYKREWAFSTNEACGAGGEGCGSEVVPTLTPDKTPFYYENPYTGSSQSGGFGKSYNQHYMNDDDSETESEAEDDIEDVLMIDPQKMRGKDFSKKDAVPVLDMQSFLEKGRHWKKKRSQRYQKRTGFGY